MQIDATSGCKSTCYSQSTARHMQIMICGLICSLQIMICALQITPWDPLGHPMCSMFALLPSLWSLLGPIWSLSLIFGIVFRVQMSENIGKRGLVVIFNMCLVQNMCMVLFLCSHRMQKFIGFSIVSSHWSHTFSPGDLHGDCGRGHAQRGPKTTYPCEARLC